MFGAKWWKKSGAVPRYLAIAPHPKYNFIGCERKGTLGDDNVNLRNGVLTPGQVHDSQAVETVMEDVKHGEYRVCTMDKAYADTKVRAQIEAKGAVQCVPPKSNTKNPWEYDKEMYKNRNKIERLFCSLKGGFRRIATRYDKLSSTFLSMVYFGAAIRAMRSSIIRLELLKIYA